MSKNSDFKSKKSDVSSVKLDLFLQKLEFIRKSVSNIVMTISLFQSPLIFDNKPQVKGDIQKTQEVIEIIIDDLRTIDAIVKFIRKK